MNGDGCGISHGRAARPHRFPTEKERFLRKHRYACWGAGRRTMNTETRCARTWRCPTGRASRWRCASRTLDVLWAFASCGVAARAVVVAILLLLDAAAILCWRNRIIRMGSEGATTAGATPVPFIIYCTAVSGVIIAAIGFAFIRPHCFIAGGRKACFWIIAQPMGGFCLYPCFSIYSN